MECLARPSTRTDKAATLKVLRPSGCSGEKLLSNLSEVEILTICRDLGYSLLWSWFLALPLHIALSRNLDSRFL